MMNIGLDLERLVCLAGILKWGCWKTGWHRYITQQLTPKYVYESLVSKKYLSAHFNSRSFIIAQRQSNPNVLGR